MTFAFSPCPNDTFMFAAIVNKYIDTRGYTFDFVIEDVAALNQAAENGTYDISKISYNAFMQVTAEYQLLHAGSALGHNCGPLLITADPNLKAPSPAHTVAIPGAKTTANLLLSIAYPELQHKEEMIFSDVEDALSNGKCDLGLIIHENRFTYQDKGLYKVQDLGEYWEREMQAPIPLGGIAIKRGLDHKLQNNIDEILKESIQFAFAHPEKVMPYVQQYAQEMDPKVMKSHIDLYVNENSIALSEAAYRGIEQLKEAVKRQNPDLSLSEPIFIEK